MTSYITAGVTLAALSVNPTSASAGKRLAASVLGDVDPQYPTLERPEDDPRTWLEAVEADESLDWVRTRNAHALEKIGQPEKHPVYDKILAILDSKEKIPYIGRVLVHPDGRTLYYNFWQDETYPKGIWRRCTLDEYRKPQPQWETVLTSTRSARQRT